MERAAAAGLLTDLHCVRILGCAWVGDYASDHGCGKTFVEALCDPADAAQNRACSDACHYNGCGGGRCVYVATARGCYCKP